MSSTTLDLIVQREFAAAKRGDRDAFGRLVAATQRMVTSVALAQVRDLQLSEDIAQETFLSAWQKLGQMRSAMSFLPWLREVARNRAIDYLRTRRYREQPATAEQDQQIAASADSAPGPADALSRAQDSALLAQALDELPAESREVLLLYYREAQSSQAVAALLGLSDAAVRKRLQRARASLHAELLARLSGVASNSAPGLSFTVLITSTLGSGASPAGAGSVGVSALLKGTPKLLLGAAGALVAALALVLGAVAVEIGIYLRRAESPEVRRALLRHGAVYGALMGTYVLVLWWASRNAWALWQTLSVGAAVSVAIMLLALERGRLVAKRSDPDAPKKNVDANSERPE